MKEKITVYRADDYQKDMGSFLGFFDTLENAKSHIQFSNEIKMANGTFSQITEFTVIASELKKGDIHDMKFMAGIWGGGEIAANYYFIE